VGLDWSLLSSGTVTLNAAVSVLLDLLVGLNKGNRVTLSFALGIDQHLTAVLNHVLLLLASDLHVTLELDAEFFNSASEGGAHISELGEEEKLTLILVKIFNSGAEDIIGNFNLGVLQLGHHTSVGIIVSIIAISLGSLTQLVLVLIVGQISLPLLNKLIVNVLQALKSGNSELLILTGAGLLEQVIVDSQHLQVVLQAHQVLNGFFEVGELVATDREHIQFVQFVQTIQLGDVVLVEGQISELCAVVQILNLGDQVERQIQPF